MRAGHRVSAYTRGGGAKRRKSRKYGGTPIIPGAMPKATATYNPNASGVTNVWRGGQNYPLGRVWRGGRYETIPGSGISFRGTAGLKHSPPAPFNKKNVRKPRFMGGYY